MSTLNKIMLIGHLGDDVKITHFDGGNSIGRFPLATSETYTKKDTGEKVTTTEWHNIVVRNKSAEICEKYLSKGDKVYVEGKIKTRKWTDQQGVEKYSTEIHVFNFVFLSTKDTTQSSANTPQQKKNSKPQDNLPDGSPFPTTNDLNEEDFDDLPF